MIPSRIERTSLWRKTLALRSIDEYRSEREVLRSSYLNLRQNINFLVTQISSALPELTQHDISHLDALWETASLIVGDDYELTPLEGFVIGSAFLLHDSALCFEAYENGRNGLRETIQWKDAFAEIKDSKPNFSSVEIEHQADFAALRNLHAYQAENLLNYHWKDHNIGNQFFLLENQTLRSHLGKLIGQIAASHHWNVEMVESKFNAQLNAPSGYPREWRIDPVKLAFILRCADAIHIDNERAPDFLHILLKRSGVSFDHWTAQNHLAKADIDQTDLRQETLLFTSTIDFKEADSNAWYVAYDAICLADKEIKSCNAILEKRGSRAFKVKRIRGVENPEDMSIYIKADGWEPRSARVYVGNVEKIIQNLGGTMLYGSDSNILEIVLREMIQNARDSIKARAVFDNNFEGKINLKINRDSLSTWIIIEDNGIGMSERILTGPLLDFGTSFWTSSIVQNELPGLRSSKFRSIGKFGIGFYSIFMLAEQVLITSRSYTAGLSDARQLKFNNGFSLRPILSKGASPEFNTSLSTQIKIKIKKDFITEDFKVIIRTNKAGANSFKVPFESCLSVICAGLDVPVYYKELEKLEIKLHENINSPDFNVLEWLEKISFADYQQNNSIKESILQNYKRLKPIVEDGITLGLAAISIKVDFTCQDFLSVKTVGGLTSHLHGRDGEDFIGYLDYSPKSAKREIGQYSASDETIKAWAHDQLKELMSLDLSPYQKYSASAALSKFKIDPSGLALILTVFNGTRAFLSFDQLALLSTTMKVAFLKSGMGGDHMETYHQIQQLHGYALITPLANSSFLSLKRVDGIPENNYSILDCLYRAIVNLGLIPTLTEQPYVGKNIFGNKIGALLLSAHSKFTE